MKYKPLASDRMVTC